MDFAHVIKPTNVRSNHVMKHFKQLTPKICNNRIQRTMNITFASLCTLNLPLNGSMTYDYCGFL